jgi:hypothetical protein
MAVSSTVNDIIRALPGTGSFRGSKIIGELEAAKIQLLEGNKYQTRIDLDSSGLGGVYDDLQSKLITSSKFEASQQLASTKLALQQSKLTDLSQVVGKFRSPSYIAGEEVAFADSILSDIADILNSQEEGEYIFGGKDSKTRPVLDLSKSNIINGRASTNYTNASTTEINFTIAENSVINLGFISANNPGIASIIAAINVFKEDPTSPAIDGFINDYNDHFAELQTKVSSAIKETEGAQIINSRLKTIVTEQIKSVGGGDMIEAVETIKALMFSFLANLSAVDVNSKINNALLNRG